MTLKNIIIFLIILLSTELKSQNFDFNFFEQSNFLKPYISDTKSPFIKTETVFINKLDNNYYLQNISSRPLIESHLGTELPLLLIENNRVKYIFEANIGNTVLVDLFEKTTAPVINTDYMFGIKTGFTKNTDNKFIKNIGAEIVPVFHESTHIGDEFAIHGYSVIPDFKRVNISYEAWKISFFVNSPDTLSSNLLSTKVGIEGLWGGKGARYFTDSLETKGEYIPESKKFTEYFLQFNLQRTSGFAASKSWKQIISAEIANRIKLSYEPLIEEERRWTINIYGGWQHISKKNGKNIGFFLRYYYGTAPYGQFRNIDNFRNISFSIAYF